MSVSLSTLRDYWKNVSDWVTGTSASKPSVTASIDNFPTTQNVVLKGRIIKDSWSGSANITKTFPTEMNGFAIVSDGDTDITVTINGLSFVVKSGEDLDGVFDPFTTLDIVTTSAYRAMVKE